MTAPGFDVIQIFLKRLKCEHRHHVNPQRHKAGLILTFFIVGNMTHRGLCHGSGIIFINKRCTNRIGAMASQTDYFFKRTGSLLDKEISLDSLDLQILALIEQKKSARQIGREMSISPSVLKQKLTALHKQKVIKVIENFDCMDTTFADNIRKKLILLVGPMGSMIVDDVLDTLKLDADQIPKLIAMDFVQMVAKEIPDESMSLAFRQSILES